jgi:hypothetical protein
VLFHRGRVFPEGLGDERAPFRRELDQAHPPIVGILAFQNKGLADLERQAQTMIGDLLWWTTALKTARKA